MAEAHFAPAWHVGGGAFWVGNGTTALYAALKALGCRDSYVAVQPNVCPNVVAAILATRNKPWFVDIERSRLGLDPVALREALPEVSAVIAVHSYGIPCRITEIRELVAARAIPLIEDCAQAEGAALDGIPVGRYGDVAAFSFGKGKIIDAAGGGVVSSGNREIAWRIEREIGSLPAEPEQAAAQELSADFKDLYNNFYPDRLTTRRRRFSQSLRTYGLRLRGKASADTCASVSAMRESLAANVAERNRKARLYRSALASLPLATFPEIPAGASPWRFNLFLPPGIRQPVFRALLRADIPVSSWYPDISRFMDEEDFRAGRLPNARWLDEAVLNLWVDQTADDEQITSWCGALRESVAEALAASSFVVPS